MTIERMDHVGIVVDDLEAATAFFADLGLKLQDPTALDSEDIYRLCYVRGPEGIIVELAEKIG
jgi:catechol 2,3-dioxygenase-like lactoylglutathione lyase family enzyme